MNITIQNPARNFLSPGIYQATTDKSVSMVELVKHSGLGMVFKAVGINNGRFLRPVDPLFWLDSKENIEIEVEKVAHA